MPCISKPGSKKQNVSLSLVSAAWSYHTHIKLCNPSKQLPMDNFKTLVIPIKLFAMMTRTDNTVELQNHAHNYQILSSESKKLAYAWNYNSNFMKIIY
jgi:hypothetical protein